MGISRWRAGIAPRTRSKSCSCKSCPARASRSSTHPAGSCSSTGKNPAPRNQRAEEDDPMRLRTAVIDMIALAALGGCGGYTASGPYGGGGGSGGGGGGGGPVGSVTVGSNGRIVFLSAHNGTANPAADTVAAGSTVTSTWPNNQGVSHSVQSQGPTACASRPIMSGSGQTYAVTFTTPGTYQYDCAVHGTAMNGTIVVR